VLCPVTCPSCAATISCTIYNPSPVPPGFVVYNGSKICPSRSAGIPRPVSCTCRWMCVACGLSVSVTVPPWGMASKALLYQVEHRPTQRTGVKGYLPQVVRPSQRTVTRRRQRLLHSSAQVCTAAPSSCGVRWILAPAPATGISCTNSSSRTQLRLDLGETLR